MQRRPFLVSAASCLAVAGVGKGLATHKPFGADIELGFSLYGMKALPLNVAIRTCAEIGYQHLELALLPGYPTAPETFTETYRSLAIESLHKHRMGVPCLMTLMSLVADAPRHAESLALIARAGAIAKQIVPDKPPILESVLGGQPAKWSEQQQQMVSQLNDWADAAEAAGTTIAIKAHVASAVNTPERLLWLLEQVRSKAIQVAYDYSHFELQGIAMDESMKLLLPRTRFIHVKDSTGDAGKFQFLLPGDGRTDYVKYFSLLKSFGYVGPVCVEVSGQLFNKPDYDPLNAARRSYAFLRKSLRES